MDKTTDQLILEELRQIKKILAYNLVASDSPKRQIERLSSMAFRPAEIAEILGVRANSVSVALMRIRKSKGRARTGSSAPTEV